MRTLAALLLTTLCVADAPAADPKPVVIIPAAGATRTTPFGDGVRTTTSTGTTYTTTKFGTGTLTRGSDGKTYVTLPFGTSTITRER